jgi:hypothetical protein
MHLWRMPHLGVMDDIRLPLTLRHATIVNSSRRQFVGKDTPLSEQHTVQELAILGGAVESYADGAEPGLGRRDSQHVRERFGAWM